MSRARRFVTENPALLLIVLVGCGLRIWGIDFGLPYPLARPDEEHLLDPAIRYFTGDFNPHNFVYGPFFSYLTFLAIAVRFCVGWLTGLYASRVGLFAQYIVDPTPYYILGRCLSAFAGTATLGVIYKIGERLFSRRDRGV